MAQLARRFGGIRRVHACKSPHGCHDALIEFLRARLMWVVREMLKIIFFLYSLSDLIRRREQLWHFVVMLNR